MDTKGNGAKGTQNLVGFDWNHVGGANGKNICDYVSVYNYTCEVHDIITEDDYVIQTFRIPIGHKETVYTSRPVVLMVHGLLSSPFDWLVMGPEKSLGFKLADEGYDVWMMACRGNTYSLKHLTLEADSLQFWNFSFHEVGYYDIPANIEYITILTGNEKVSYVGHSKGGTSYVAMSAGRPEYNSRIQVSLLFSPVLYMQDVGISIFDAIKNSYEEIKDVGTDLQLKDILPFNPVYNTMVQPLCQNDSKLCGLFMGFICGYDFDQLENSAMVAITTYDPAGSSLQTFLHYLQIANSGIFRQYDWGEDGNKKMYNQATPPEYNLTLATAPVILFIAQNDFFVGPTDYKRLNESLPNVTTYVVPYKNMNHIGYIIAKDVLELVTIPAINFLNLNNNNLAPKKQLVKNLV